MIQETGRNEGRGKVTRGRIGEESPVEVEEGQRAERRAKPEGNCFIEVACRANDESRAAIYLQFAFDLPAGFIATRNAN